MTKISQYHRHIALMLAADLTEEIADARAVLAAMHTLVEEFLDDKKGVANADTLGGPQEPTKVVPLR